MEIYYNQAKIGPTVMTLGTFDGVHLGHQQIINLAVKRAKKLGYDSCLFTFFPHPLKAISPDKAPKALTSWSQKKRLIQSLGINQLIVQNFDEEFSQIPYQQFVEEYLVKRFKVKEIIVGEDFRCGSGGQGTPAKLKELGEEFGFEVEAIPSIKLNNREISSTYIRNLILEGKVSKVKEQLGRNFTLDCKVVQGDQRGRKLGFPTANLDPLADYVLPPLGVYACRVRLEGKLYGGAVHLGLLPTFDKNKFSIEVHILDFNQNIYDQSLELEFIKRIRPEEKFPTVEGLVARMKDDVRITREILNKLD
ncbi:riboflavin kinase/FMN adenylyltransferase [Orenia metallireducens]|uniref:Riboflavin biosynthesis protein n=1 Tax=Orenia metallireducens TaxID=1413210 RepID=A0A285FLQ6_9FIRM|nr:bifunctional riboflavin kinase/FAD synthetase [Orenia metallireducens]PRX33621.1 riboflavin kinase/FMN adenylyltransferase [Orenia metallireducens]SNY12237.1 riboflavin kinase / FMN adenylyltransferase [Orenia metallireducens]